MINNLTSNEGIEYIANGDGTYSYDSGWYLAADGTPSDPFGEND